ncbi:MAG: hypothetical protein J7M25_12875 [Deltaproteobacteria bacterium]|nr:hypothetical protein [Deltaproteobacteria bacterium]
MLAPGDAEPKRSGLDFDLPQGLLDSQAESAILFVLNFAVSADLEVFDPQLGRLVTSADSSLILVRWREQNAYLLHTVGSDGDTTGGGAYYPDFPHQMKPVTIFWLIVGGLFLLFALLSRVCV